MQLAMQVIAAAGEIFFGTDDVRDVGARTNVASKTTIGMVQRLPSFVQPTVFAIGTKESEFVQVFFVAALRFVGDSNGFAALITVNACAPISV